MIIKTDFDAKLSRINRKITENKTKNLLVENELNKLQIFDLSYFIGKSHFEEDGTQNYLVFQPINRYFKVIANTDYVSSWKSKGLSAESIKPPTTSDNSLTTSGNSLTNSSIHHFENYIQAEKQISFKNGLEQWWTNPLDQKKLRQSMPSKQNGKLELTVRPGYLLCSLTEKVEELMFKKYFIILLVSKS